MTRQQALDHLAEASMQGRLVLFCGAGVSKDAPANLPTADEIVCNVLERLMDALPDLRRDLLAGSYLYRTAPFELFMGVIQQALLFRTYEVLEPLTAGDPNDLHHCLAKLLVCGKAKHLITTNFDNLFERALTDAGRIRFYYGWGPDVDQLEKEFARPSIAKVHGSFVNVLGEDITQQTVATTLDKLYFDASPHLLRRWAALLSGHTILFLGYSGRDRLDVMRMLPQLQNSPLVWFLHSPEESVGISRSTESLLSREVRGLAGKDGRVILLCWFSVKWRTGVPR
jgi:hypothetical protein